MVSAASRSIASYDTFTARVEATVDPAGVEKADAAVILVNAIAPGPTDTPMLREDLGPEALEAFARTFPMARPGQPAELAQAAVFLVSEESSFVTGAVLAVDGGQTAGV